MTTTKIRYKEGDVFRIEVTHTEAAFGVVCRVGRKGRNIFLAYFYEHFPDGRSGTHPIDVMRCYDKHLTSGRWKIVGSIQPWDRDAWPTPRFWWQMPPSTTIALIELDDEDPSVQTSSRFVTEAPPDAFAGGAVTGGDVVEEKLRRKLQA